MLVTGEQFEIRRGTVRAVATEVGGALRLFEVDGVPYLESYGADIAPPCAAGAVLVPWPNRVADGRWTFAGHAQQLALTEPLRHHAIHGLARYLCWQPIHRTVDSVELAAMINVQPGWPVPVRATIRYAVDDNGLTVTHTVTNMGNETVPVGVGAHPYPRVGHVATDDCRLRLAASTVLPVDVRQLPAGPEKPVAGTEYDFRSPKPVRDVKLDTAFGGCAPAPSDPEHLVRHAVLAPDGSGVELWAEPAFGWVQVYTAGNFPGRGRAIAIEPMTCPPDALNSGTDLHHLEPTVTRSFRWGLTPLPPTTGSR
ncbi:aldose 1-epimerase [Longimycelium tulufanense]|uniref:Aldose 1-epimerase n=1 Tax=Longimycelium tulufanense TaxID=907463 RepID=A0A8J3FXK7_9PSEU|nr:aldose 1-epimerase family protein [Longimycelium tulufanense]GGM74967.1 aldose 1-epimerase [Longimycelium tulufanense]